jgi:type III secretory pathway component EscS
MNLEFHQSITNPQNQNLKLFLKLIIILDIDL